MCGTSCGVSKVKAHSRKASKGGKKPVKAHIRKNKRSSGMSVKKAEALYQQHFYGNIKLSAKKKALVDEVLSSPAADRFYAKKK